MMNYNFSGAVKAKEAGKALSAGIKKAKFMGVEFSNITSQKDGEVYKTLVLKLDVEGYGPYSQNFFEPSSDERKENAWGGVNASPLDHFLISVREILEAVDPQIIKDIDSGEKELSGTFKKIVDKIASWTEDYIGDEVEVKFVPGNNGYVNMPSFPARITKNGELGIATRFIGHNLAMTPAEQKKIDAAAKAAPTNMAKKSVLADMADDLSDVNETKGSEEEDDLPF